jgi:hypothetical protein
MSDMTAVRLYGLFNCCKGPNALLTKVQFQPLVEEKKVSKHTEHKVFYATFSPVFAGVCPRNGDPLVW